MEANIYHLLIAADQTYVKMTAGNLAAANVIILQKEIKELLPLFRLQFKIPSCSFFSSLLAKLECCGLEELSLSKTMQNLQKG